MATFVPAKFQAALPLQDLIIQHKPEGDDVVPMDVVFVGAGPAGLSGAIELAKLVQRDGSLGDIQIGVLEKAQNLGGHNLSGAVVNPVGFRELFPEMKFEDFPLRRAVSEERVYMLTQGGRIRLPTPPTMVNHGNHIASICEIVRWLGQQAEGLGINILTSFAADALLAQGSTIGGVRTTALGLKRDGSPGGQHMPPTDLSARVVVLSEGTRGPLTQAYLQHQKITSKYPQIYALGVKELWKVKKAPAAIYHTLGWPLPRTAFGGSWLYPLADDMVSFGLVAGLDAPNPRLDVHNLLQKMKTHPLFQEILGGGEIVEWGAKTIPEGGYHAIPERLSGDGLVILGDAAGLVNVPALKGIHYAMLSGIYAARAIFAALKKGDISAASLKAYDDTLRASPVLADLHKVRHMRQAFKSGFFIGGLKSAMMIATGGAFPHAPDHQVADADEPRTDGGGAPETWPKGSIRKVDAVYLSGNKTRDDIPQHLIVGRDIPADVADFYTHLCPAGVYERVGDTLRVNAPNCVDCKATDVVGPRWRPREGGSGPNYNMM